MHVSLPWILAALLAGAAGCAAPPTALARAQEAAQELNLDARFGRNELAMEHVAPAERDDFALHHQGWGTRVRVADLELAGMKAHGNQDVDVIVRVAWYRPEQQELRVTTLKQRWHDKDGWHLVGEERLDGDVGLIGEPVVYAAPPAQPPARFPTIRLGGTDPAAEDGASGGR
jgi:hypothetical protein